MMRSDAVMTKQVPDRLEIDGERHVMMRTPWLFAPGDDREDRYDFVGLDSANRSGVVSHWRVIDGMLHLVEVEATAYRRDETDISCDKQGWYTRLTLAHLHDQTGPVPVDCFTGEIDLDLEPSFDTVFEPPQRLRRLRFIAGRLISDEIIVGFRPPRRARPENP